MKTLVTALLVAAVAAPGFAQAPGDRTMHAGPGTGPSAYRDPVRPMPFAGMSPSGRRAMATAMAAGRGDNADHQRVRAARDRMLALLSADRLDTAAVRRTMDEERIIATAMHTRRQAALLQALQGLSVADRRAFVADARAMRGRFEAGFKRLNKQMRARGGRDDGPPPGPPPF